jgi:hypothetical protein
LLATARVLGEGALEHILKAGREIGIERPQSGRWVVDVRPELLEVVVAIEYDSAGEHVKQHAPERVDVGAAVDVGTTGLLGRDVVDRAERRPGPGRCSASARRVMPKSVR